MTTCFEDLHESNEFLNIVLANINSAVLVVDENLQIHQFNDFFLELFDSSLDTFVEKSFGQVTGCVNAIVENKPCGQTSQCKNCILRRSLVQTLLEKVPADKTTLDRIFYINGEAKQKHLEFSTRPIYYQGQKLILVIIYDVTDIEEKNIELKKKQHQIEQDLKAAAAIQQSLLPNTLPDIPKIDMAWRFEPCGQIGGDIFNVRSLDDTSIGLYMLDVCGHGVPAALIAVSVSQFLQGGRDYSLMEPERVRPHTILERLNQSFPFERFESFFSIHLLYLNRHVFTNPLIHPHFDYIQGFGFNLRKMRKIKTESVRCHQRSGLLDVVAQHLAQCGMEDVRGGVV